MVHEAEVTFKLSSFLLANAMNPCESLLEPAVNSAWGNLSSLSKILMWSHVEMTLVKICQTTVNGIAPF